MHHALTTVPDLGRVDLADSSWSFLVAGDSPTTAVDETWFVSAIRSGGDVVGLVAVEGGSVTDHDDERLLAELAQAAGVAVENLRAIEQEHRTALILQRSLLPAILPPLDGVSLVARYRAADGQSQIGGDFFDAFATDDGRAHVVIGDVQGHSLEAAVLMAELPGSRRTSTPPGRCSARCSAVPSRSPST